MYISVNNCRTQGLRKAYINSMTNDRHYNIKALKNIDKDLARSYTNTKYYGGSLKSFWEKAKRFGKRILNSAITTTRNMYKPVKWLVHQAASNDTIKGILGKLGDAVGSTVGVPGLGKIINQTISTADNISDGIEKIFKTIVDKNPNATKDEIKELIKDAKKEIIDVSSTLPITPEQQKKVEEAVKNVKPKDYINKIGNKVGVKDLSDKLDKVDYNKGLKAFDSVINKIKERNPSVSTKEASDLVKSVVEPAEELKKEGENVSDEKVKETLEALPDAVKAAGYAKIKAAAGYMPYIDKSTLTEKERVGKGGRALKPMIRVVKPALITKRKGVFTKHGLPEYNAGKIGDVVKYFTLSKKGKECGRMNLGGDLPQNNASCGRMGDAGRMKMAGSDKIDRDAILARLKNRIKK